MILEEGEMVVIGLLFIVVPGSVDWSLTWSLKVSTEYLVFSAQGLASSADIFRLKGDSGMENII